MSSDSDRLLREDVERLRREKGLCPLTPEEAEKELKAAPAHPLSSADIDSVLDKVKSGELTEWDAEPMPDWANSLNTADVSDDVLQLNRNPGVSDPDTDKLIDDLRRKALADEERPAGLDS